MRRFVLSIVKPFRSVPHTGTDYMEVHGFIDRIVVKFHIIRACQHYKTSTCLLHK